jgi:5-methylcytosine-specific restriction protein A
MKLIDTLDELLTNTLYLEKKLLDKNSPERPKAVDLIKRGSCFLKYSIDGRTLFAPSRFIGYKTNTIQDHISNRPHGGITNGRINKILKTESKVDEILEKKYLAFCSAYGIEPNKTGNFGAQRKYWDLDCMAVNVYGDIELPEGRKRYITHVSRERNPRIRKIAINNFLHKNGRIYCEGCDFDFERKYGTWGKDFIECHHTIPLSMMKFGHKTKPEDIVLLCSNCHRIIHRKSDWLSIKQLKAIIKKHENGYR